MAKNDFADFAKDMRKIADHVSVMGSELAKAGTLAAVETLVNITPVDTSEHKSNWQVSLGSAVGSAIPAYFLGKYGSTSGASGKQAVSVAQAQLMPKKEGQPIYISNLAPAITYLDQGSSTQFAGGFVPRAVIVFNNAVDRAATEFWNKLG